MDELGPLNLDFREYLFRRYDSEGRRYRFQGETLEAFEAWQPRARRFWRRRSGCRQHFSHRARTRTPTRRPMEGYITDLLVPCYMSPNP